ncbi:MAG: molybdopterin-guanine dinucleotide biosynthesis protein MobB [Thermodesulfobacteriota bacterium]
MKVRSKVWLVDDSGETVFGEGRRRILELIDELGSMQATAKALGMSYRGVWARIKATEERLQVKLVETSVGRGKNRGSRLTPEAKKFLADYRDLTEKGMAVTDELFAGIFQGRPAPAERLAPAVAVVGPPGAGKTDLIARLISGWAARGIKAGALRTESPGRDQTAEVLLAAGAPCVMASAQGRLTVNYREPAELAAETIAANYAYGCDLVLVESRERMHLPTIEVFRRNLGSRLLTRKKKHLLATVGDRPDDKDHPHFDLKDFSGLMELVEKQVLAPRDKGEGVRLKVNGRKVPMLPFVRDIIKNAVLGMASSLKSCENPREIELIIK